jgi:hypothetical protein
VTRASAVLAALLLFSSPLLAMRLNGSWYGQTLLTFPADENPDYLATTALSLRIKNTMGEKSSFAAELAFDTTTATNRDAFSVLRGSATFGAGDFTAEVGRFLPRWGRTYFFKPVDLFVPKVLLKNDVIYPGVDGADLRWHMTDLSFVQLVALPERDTERSTAGLCVEWNVWKTDFDLLAFYDGKRNRKAFGLDFKGDLFFGVFADLLYEFTDDIDYDLGRGEKGRFKIAGGLDYSWKDLMVAIEGLYDETGASTRDEYDYLALLRGERSLLAKSYLFADVRYGIPTRNQQVGASCIANLVDESYAVFPYWGWEFLQGTSLTIAAYFLDGRAGTELSPERFGKYLLTAWVRVRF